MLSRFSVLYVTSVAFLGTLGFYYGGVACALCAAGLYVMGRREVAEMGDES